jgi:hypothetical protein
VIVSDPQPIALDLNITATLAQPVDGEEFNLFVTENAGLTFTDPSGINDSHHHH